jgi:hypothetical protein
VCTVPGYCEDGLCVAGRIGPGCTECDRLGTASSYITVPLAAAPRYYAVGNRCLPCPPPDRQKWPIVLLAIVLGTIGLVVIWKVTLVRVVETKDKVDAVRETLQMSKLWGRGCKNWEASSASQCHTFKYLAPCRCFIYIGPTSCSSSSTCFESSSHLISWQCFHRSLVVTRNISAALPSILRVPWLGTSYHISHIGFASSFWR